MTMAINRGQLRRPVRIELTPADPAWSDWLTHLDTLGLRDVREAAELAGAMTVTELWPCPGAPTPTVSPRAMAAVRQKRITQRMLGEAGHD